jgi:hypothetical protein
VWCWEEEGKLKRKWRANKEKKITLMALKKMLEMEKFARWHWREDLIQLNDGITALAMAF